MCVCVYVCVLLRKFSTVWIHSKIFHTFSSILFSMFEFILGSLIHLNFSFAQSDKYRSVYIFLHEDNLVLSAPFVEDTVFFAVCVSGFFIKNQVSISVWICVWVFNLIPSINIFIFVLISCVLVSLV